MIKERGFWGLEIELSEKCGLKCLYCPQSHIATTLSPEVLEKAILTHGWEAVELTGGEPFLIPELLEKAIVLAKDGKVENVSVYSNGTIPLTLDYLRHLKSLGLSAIHFSVFSLNEDLWRRFRGGSWEQFNTLLNNIKTASEVLPVYAEVMWTRHNHTEIFESAKTLWRMGVSVVELQYPIPTSNYRGLEPTLNQIREVMSTFGFYRTIMPRPIVVNCFFIPACVLPRSSAFYYEPCTCGWGMICLKPNGKVSICNLTNRIVGDLNEQDWEEIFNNTRSLLDSFEMEQWECEDCYLCSRTPCYNFDANFKGNYKRAFLDWRDKYGGES